MSVRRLRIDELKVGMTVLERSGRAVIEESRPCYGESGWFFAARYTEGEWKGEICEHRGILDNYFWIEEHD